MGTTRTEIQVHAEFNIENIRPLLLKRLRIEFWGTKNLDLSAFIHYARNEKDVSFIIRANKAYSDEPRKSLLQVCN